MAELAKKLRFLKNGTEQTAKAYSTTDEVGSGYITNKIDGVTCYIPIGSTSDARATNGRVIKMLYVKKVIVDEVWQQPILSANGTMGGSEFACSASATNTESSGTATDAWGVFDNNTNTYWRSGTTSGWIQFYNPVPLKVSAIKWGYFYSYPTGGNVQGSNDGTTWTALNTWTNSSEADFTINLSTQQYYKYYRINITGVNKDVIHAHSLTITATYQKEVEKYVGQHDDYDYSTTTETYAILATGKPPYTEILEHPSSANGGGAGDGINSLYSRTGTFVVPEGVTRVRVAMCSGGKSSSSNGVGNSWQSSYFGSIDSNANATNWCRGCDASFTFKNYNTSDPGFVTDQYGGSSKSGNGRWGAPYRSGDGTSGYYAGYVDVKPGQSIAWRAGRGGNKAGVGFVLIAYGGDI